MPILRLIVILHAWFALASALPRPGPPAAPRPEPVALASADEAGLMTAVPAARQLTPVGPTFDAMPRVPPLFPALWAALSPSPVVPESVARMDGEQHVSPPALVLRLKHPHATVASGASPPSRLPA